MKETNEQRNNRINEASKITIEKIKEGVTNEAILDKVAIIEAEYVVSQSCLSIVNIVNIVEKLVILEIKPIQIDDSGSHIGTGNKETKYKRMKIDFYFHNYISPSAIAVLDNSIKETIKKGTLDLSGFNPTSLKYTISKIISDVENDYSVGRNMSKYKEIITQESSLLISKINAEFTRYKKACLDLMCFRIEM